MNEQTRASMIMIVDDTPENLHLLLDMLLEQGHLVAAFRDGEQALNAAANSPPDLVLLDIRMPGMDGFEVCRRLKANPDLQDIPVLFVSILSGSDSVVSAFAAGAADYVTKPFKAEEILARVNTHLRLRRLSLECSKRREQLEKAFAEKDKLVSIVLDDLRSPMSELLIAAEMLANEDEDLQAEDFRHVVRIMKKNSQTLFALLNDMMQLSRLSRGDVVCRLAPCDMNELVRNSLSTVGDAAGQKDVSLHCDVPDNLTVLADKYMINTALRNLLLNAVKFSSRGSEVSITARQEGKTVVLSIQDYGIGMDQAMLDKVFTFDDEKKQLGTEGERGSGLGLILCREFVQRHGGRIWLESAPNQGTAAHMALPVSG